jgi:hypothetical protein
MPKGQDSSYITVLIGALSGLFAVCFGLAIWILNSLNSQLKKLFEKTEKTENALSKLQGEHNINHKK